MRRLLCLALMVTAASPGRAVAAQSETVPRELVDALLRQTGGSQLLVGRMPDGFPQRFTVTRDARTLGSITTYGTTTVVISTSATPDTVMADVTRQLRAAGWKAAPLPPAPRGFQESETSVPHVFCAGDTVITVRAFPRPTGGTSLITTHASGNSRSCDPVAQTPNRPPPELPTLRNPPGSDGTGSCNARAPNMTSVQNGSGTTLRTSMTPDSILAHYGRQLRAAGWSPLPPPSVTTSWTQPDSAGTRVEATLSVVPNRQIAGCYAVNLNVVRLIPNPQ